MITAVVVEGRRPAEVAHTYGVSRSWVYELVARYRTDGDAAFEPRSRRPHHSPTTTPADVVELVIATRDQLAAAGHDAGCDTIVWHLRHHQKVSISRSSVHRILRGAGRITPEPKKRPRASYIRFQAEQPNELWQSDFTHYPLIDGTDTEIISWLDDCSRKALNVSVHLRITGPIALATFRRAVAKHGIPAATLTDNGMVYTARFAGGRNGRNARTALEAELAALGVEQRNSRPNHPTTCGKIERFQQTLKNWLRHQPNQPATLAQLQALCDQFVTYYNQHRPHRSNPNNATPDATYHARPKATPTTHTTSPGRVRHDRVNSGNVTLRINGDLHHIAVGRTYDRTPVIVLAHDLDVRIIHATTGELIRTLTIDPNRRYHGTGNPRGGPQRPYGPRKRTKPPK